MLVMLVALFGVLLVPRVRQRAAHRAQAELRAIFETAPIGHLVLDADDRIVSANAALGRIARWHAPVLTGLPLEELVEPADLPLLRIALAQLRHGVTPQLETEVRLRPIGNAEPVTTAIHAAVLEGDRAQRLLLQVLDVSERKRVEAQLQHLADHDPLTGLANRRRFEQELARHVAHARRYGAEGAVVVLDVDDFKTVNDTLGHAAGDRVIAQVAEALSGRLRTTDVLARLGGDEFAILLPKADRAGAETLARSLVETVRGRVRAGEDERPVTISVGVVAFGDLTELDAEAIVAAADVAMYEAKGAGRDGHVCFAAAPTVAA
ncbi:MAG: sensor domain-containing diguanylate cyclase [Conexibacter sp.]